MEVPAWVMRVYTWIKRLLKMVQLMLLCYLFMISIFSAFKVQMLFFPIPFYLQYLCSILFSYYMICLLFF